MQLTPFMLVWFAVIWYFHGINLAATTLMWASGICLAIAFVVLVVCACVLLISKLN